MKTGRAAANARHPETLTVGEDDEVRAGACRVTGRIYRKSVGGASARKPAMMRQPRLPA
jgi:hypothetical protein